jgi:hypothetical protein
MAATRITLTGDFTCPWSYLASRRAALLADAGVEVDFRVVEHDPWQPQRFLDSSLRFDRVQREIEQVAGLLLPDEELPYALAGFGPRTRAAGAGYAAAYAAGVGPHARRLLFGAFWVNGVDIGDPRMVRTLLVDAVRSGASSSEALRQWGYAVDVTGGPISSTGWRLLHQWRDDWTAGKETVPVLEVDGDEPRYGEEAVEWLGEELLRRDVELAPGPVEAPAPRRKASADLSWVSQHGGRWLREFQAGYAHA